MVHKDVQVECQIIRGEILFYQNESTELNSFFILFSFYFSQIVIHKIVVL